MPKPDSKQNKRKGKNHNRKHNRNRNRSSRHQDEDEMLREMEDALLDQTARIITELMNIIKDRRSEDTKENDTSRTYERSLERPMDMLRDSVRASLNEDNNNNNNYTPRQDQRGNETNVNMNIQRTRGGTPEVNIATTENSRVSFQGGNQLYPGSSMRGNRRQNPMMNPRMQSQRNQPVVQNRLPPTRGPGGRAEAPRDNVLVGTQALQYAARVANRVRSRANNSQPTQASGRVPQAPRGPVQMAPPRASAPTATAPRAAPVAPRAPAPVARSAPAVAPRAPAPVARGPVANAAIAA